jgi:hypothetical protein
MLGWGVLVCGGGILLNVAMLKRRGKNAAVMAIAFLCMGLALLLAYLGAPPMASYVMGAFVAVLLGLDLVLRVKKKVGDRP